MSRRATVQTRKGILGAIALFVAGLVILGVYWVRLTREAVTDANRRAMLDARDDAARERWGAMASEYDVVPTPSELMACAPGSGLSTRAWQGSYGGSEGAPAVTVTSQRLQMHKAGAGFTGEFCLLRPLTSGPGRFRAMHFTAGTQVMSVALVEITTDERGLSLLVAPTDAPAYDVQLGPFPRHSTPASP